MSVASQLVVGLSGPRLDPREAAWLELWRPAGVILFARNVRDREQCRTLIRDVRACLPPAAEICADHEGGPVSFLEAAVGPAPAPRTLGDLDDPLLTRQVHREMAERLRDVGLDRVLAPCCDVLTERRNPVIGSRSFGDQANRVAAHVTAAVQGLVDAGLGGCAKHWPGHGGTGVDTHDRQAAAAAAVEEPFQAALAAGVDHWMVGHLMGAGDEPASLDASRLEDLRRRTARPLTLWCDDISMGALRPSLARRGVAAGDDQTSGLVAPERMTRAWLDAVAAGGCDRLLLRGIPWAALPLSDGEPGPGLPAVGVQTPDQGVAPTPAARRAWRRAVERLPVSLPGPRLLWIDATTGDRWGEAAGLATALADRWPELARLDAAVPRLATQPPFDQVLVTAHRPLTVGQAKLVGDLTAAIGEAITAGHPSLSADLGRLLGPGWTIGSLAGCRAEDLAPLIDLDQDRVQ